MCATVEAQRTSDGREIIPLPARIVAGPFVFVTTSATAWQVLCQERTHPTAVAALCERANDDIWATTPLARWARVLSMELHDAHCAEQCLFFLSETKPPAQRSRICPFPLSTRPTRSHPQVILMVGFRVAALFALLYRSRPTGDRAY